MIRLNVIFASVFALSLAAVPAVLAYQEQAPQEQSPRMPPGRFGRGAELEHEIKPYDKVITKDAKTQAGIFKVHQIKDKVYYEIPVKELDKDFLWVSQIARTTLGVGYGGQFLGDRVVRWERHEDRIFLKNVSYQVVADDKLPISRAVHAANNDTIISAFYIEALGPEGAPVIEVTHLFTNEVPEFSPRVRLRARGFDPARSFVDRVVAYPQNVEVTATQTFTSPIEPPTSPGQGTPPPVPNPLLGTGMRPGSATIEMHYSLVKLPEDPMKPRLEDKRVGFFSVDQMDYGRDEHRAPERRYITRWRLEKKDPNAALSEPVKPIVYYIDPATPEKWRPYLKKGVEDWQVAFEAAGFKNAIICKDAPTKEEDPNWSPEDVRYSVIRWLPSTIENAVGPHISDPRTGEILNADIQFYHNVMKLASDWYFVQAGPLDPRAKTLPLPDDLEGRLIEYVVSHEVGHTLGFPHNMKASAEYPADKVRDPEWLAKMGHTPSIMDYSRFNYVAQPEDGVNVADLVPRIGPYDIYATMWGYKPVPGAATPDDERKTLDDWAREQDSKPWLRFSTPNSAGSDPGENTEAVGDADAVKSTAEGLKNLARVSDMLIPAATRPDKSYDDLGDIYGGMMGQWVLELNHVAVIVGGVDSQEKYGSQQGVIFSPVS
ncbi:MAG TPA: zinc-dependent metalloprotease, partial [Blastocatellia bacterium]|nr:zinc-dependent metalloprotease [Blastocatellia bacterium]